MPVLIKHCSLMIDKEKPGVVPAIVFIRVFDALVAYSNLTPSGITDVSHAINTAYGSGNISYHVVCKVCFVYFVFTPSQKCDNVGLLNNGVLPLAKDALYHSVSTWGNPNVAVSLVQTITTGGLRFWCGESSIGMQIFDSFSYCIK